MTNQTTEQTLLQMHIGENLLTWLRCFEYRDNIAGSQNINVSIYTNQEVMHFLQFTLFGYLIKHSELKLSENLRA